MLWLLITGLFALALMLLRRVNKLEDQVRNLKVRLDLLDRPQPEPAPKIPQPRAAMADPGPRVAPPEPDRKPSPSPWTTPRPQPEPQFDPAIPETAALDLLNEAFVQAAPRRAARARRGPPLSRDQMADWLSENGLAWIGGGVLALGGIFMVGHAAQRGLMTPAMRVTAAAMLGIVLVAVSEWLRRRRTERTYEIAAAAAAGAGGAIFYAASWAAHALYGFVGLPVAAVLMGGASAGLLALAAVHGEGLAILAIGGGLLAPAITGPGDWSVAALSLYLAAVLAGGYAAAALRQWGWTGIVALAGALLWAVAAATSGDFGRTVALAIAPVALGAAALAWRRRTAGVEEVAAGPFRLLLPAAAAAAALLLALTWASAEDVTDSAAAGLGSALLCVLLAVAVRARLGRPVLLIAGPAALGVAALSLGSGFNQEPSLELWAGLAGLAAAASSLWAALTAREEHERLYAGAGALAALLVAVAVRGPLSESAPWVAPALAMAVLAAGAWAVARRAQAPREDLALAFWVWCAATGLLAAVAYAVSPAVLPAALGLCAIALALAHVRLGWRGWLAGANAAALASLTALVNPEFLGPLFSGRTPVWAGASTAAAAAIGVAGAWKLVQRREPGSAPADALNTAAIMIALSGAFILLRLWGTGAAGETIDPFLEAGLRTALLLATGLLTAAVAGEETSLIGRWRGQAMLVLGAGHALLIQGLALNPLSAGWSPAVSGPPLLDSLAIGFLAPGLILAAATHPRIARRRELLIGFAGCAALLAALWGGEEIRRLFQGPTMHGGPVPIGRAEAAAYAVGALTGASLLMWVAARAARKAWTISPIADLVRSAARASAGCALLLAVVVFGYWASPWWGPIGEPLASQLEAGLLLGLYAIGAGIALWLVRAAEADELPELARGIRIVSVLIVFALLTLVIRWGFRGLDMRPDLQEASLETWAFSAAWALYGFALLAFAAARREADLRWAGLVVLLGTTAKVFLFDMARLEGIVRAASFLAVGALLLGAAVVARRLSGSGGLLGARRAETEEAAG